MPQSLLQANLNRTREAQDLFVHSLAERGCSLGIAVETPQDINQSLEPGG